MVRRKILGGLVALAVVAPLAMADVPVAGFGDAGFSYVNNDEKNTESPKDTNNFMHGGIDFYYTKKLSDQTNFLAEIVYEMGDDNAAILDPERLWIQYYVSPWLQVKIGREHTALGYWNDNFHHGKWLQTTVNRPQFYEFEDDGGVLPVHVMGLEFRGQGKMGPGEFGYIANIGNGRGPEVDPPQIVNDANNDKAINAVLFYELNGFRFGGTYYMDKMPGTNADHDDLDGDGEENDAGLHNKGDEAVYGAHFVVTKSGFELLSEVLFVDHKYRTKGALDAAGDEINQKDNTIMAGYIQTSYNMDKYTPYFRYDTIKNDKGIADAYTALDSVHTNYTVGLRYDLTYTSALKFEHGMSKNKGLDTKRFDVNWSFSW